MLLPYLLLLVIGSYPATVEANKHRALRFGQSPGDYIEWSPNMAPFTRQFSVCTWLKKRHQSSNPMVVYYYPHVNHGYSHGMIFGDNGVYNQVVGSDINLESEYNVPDGEWFHVCWLWSASSYTTTVYLNGEIIGSTATNEKELRTGGTMCLGNYARVKSSQYTFGGDLFKLNLYSRVLTDTEIRNMASDMCSNEEESLNSIRSLRWESIILLERSGSVTEITTDCPSPEEIEAGRQAKLLRLIDERLKTFEIRLQITEQELARTKTNLEQSDANLENVSAKLKNSEQDLAETKSTLKLFEEKLGSFNFSLTSTQNEVSNTQLELTATKTNLKQQLESVSASLNHTQEELEAATKNKVRSKWDVLFSDRFFNKKLTREMSPELKSTWNILDLFLGSNITEPFIEHLKHYHEPRELSCTNPGN